MSVSIVRGCQSTAEQTGLAAKAPRWAESEPFNWLRLHRRCPNIWSAPANNGVQDFPRQQQAMMDCLHQRHCVIPFKRAVTLPWLIDVIALNMTSLLENSWRVTLWHDITLCRGLTWAKIVSKAFKSWSRQSNSAVKTYKETIFWYSSTKFLRVHQQYNVSILNCRWICNEISILFFRCPGFTLASPSWVQSVRFSGSYPVYQNHTRSDWLTKTK